MNDHGCVTMKHDVTDWPLSTTHLDNIKVERVKTRCQLGEMGKNFIEKVIFGACLKVGRILGAEIMISNREIVLSLRSRIVMDSKHLLWQKCRLCVAELF